MAKGYPDFFGFSTFPQFGIFTQSTDKDISIPHGDDISLLTINGKGRLYGGWIEAESLKSVETVIIQILVDGAVIWTPFVSKNLLSNWLPQTPQPLVITRWDRKAEIVVYAIAMEISFANSIELLVQNLAGVAISVEAAIFWAKVT